MMRYTEKEAMVLDRVQRDFPRGTRPFNAMARDLAIDEHDLLDVIRDLRERSVIRSISGIFNPERLGYASALIAFAVDPPSVESAAFFINAHPGVSHNYLRDHHFNIWFTLPAGDQERLDAYVNILAKRAGAREYLVLPVEKMYKIGVHFAVQADGSGGSIHAPGAPSPVAGAAKYARVSGDEFEAVRILQADCPIDPEPFSRLVERERSYLDAGNVARIGAELREKGVMRRYSAVLRHREVGFKANAMTAWRPDSSRPLDEIVGTFRKSQSVSHLYLRRARRGTWDHPLFAMIHARSQDELAEIVGTLSRASGIGDYMLLPTLREFKKERVIYFSRSFEEWEADAGI